MSALRPTAGEMNGNFTRMRNLLIVCSATILWCASPLHLAAQKDAKVDHMTWDQVLQAHVNAAGEVDYAGIAGDPRFGRYLAVLERFAPAESWTRNERMAYWINAYNAFTIKLVTEHLPLKSIKDIGEPWARQFITIGGTKMSLDHIENAILRPRFKDPRIHFAINCASISCPVLLNRAYMPATLESQLEGAAARFMNDTRRNRITPAKAEVSRVFEWFKEDFTANGTLAEYLSRYSAVPVTEATPIVFMDYDWRLNAQ